MNNVVLILILTLLLMSFISLFWLASSAMSFVQRISESRRLKKIRDKVIDAQAKWCQEPVQESDEETKRLRLLLLQYALAKVLYSDEQRYSGLAELRWQESLSNEVSEAITKNRRKLELLDIDWKKLVGEKAGTLSSNLGRDGQ